MTRAFRRRSAPWLLLPFLGGAALAQQMPDSLATLPLEAVPASAAEAPLVLVRGPAAAPPQAQRALPLTVLSLPDGASRSAGTQSDFDSDHMATGPWRDGTLATRALEGTVQRSAWQLSSPAIDTLSLLEGLRSQLRDLDYDIVYECRDRDCGGFDFRYAATLLPEPDMHVDLGDYRYLAATRGSGSRAEQLSLWVSRTDRRGFIQLSHASAAEGPGPMVLLASASSTVAPPPAATPAPAVSTQGAPETAPTLATALETNGRAALDDLAFSSGTAALEPGDYPSLAALAAWLARNPDRQVMLVGHTDATGGLEANLSLSKSRASAVRSRLVEALGVTAAQLSAEGAGFLAPRASNLTEEGRAKNRRVEAVVTSTQ